MDRYKTCVCVCVVNYLSDVCGASHQIVDIVCELQLPLGRHFFDVGASQHHFIRETRDRK